MKLLKYLLSFRATRLPVGLQEFEEWADSIRELVGPGFEQVPQDDFKFVLANAVIHLGSTVSKKPKQYFVQVIRKGGANQVASQIFQDVKLRHEAAVKAAQAAIPQPAEATAQPAGASDAQKEIPTSNS